MGVSQKNEISKEQKFMNELYFEYERLMFFVAKQYASNLYEQEEIVQNALVQLLQKGDTLQKLEPNARASYIAVTLRNTAINYRRKLEREQKRQISLETVSEEMAELQLPPADTFLVHAENKAELLRAYQGLSEGDRHLLAGKYILHLSNAELAQQFQCTPGSIRMKLTRVRRRFLALLKKEGTVDE